MILSTQTHGYGEQGEQRDRNQTSPGAKQLFYFKLHVRSILSTHITYICKNIHITGQYTCSAYIYPHYIHSPYVIHVEPGPLWEQFAFGGCGVLAAGRVNQLSWAPRDHWGSHRGVLAMPTPLSPFPGLAACQSATSLHNSNNIN